MTDQSKAVDKPAEAVALDAPIAVVTVMEDRAQITRRGELELQAGRALLRVDGVTPLVADRTLRCRIRSHEQAEVPDAPRVLDVTARREYRVRAARPEKEQELRGAIDQVVDAYLSAYDQITAGFTERGLVAGGLDGLRQQIVDRLVVGPFEPEWGAELERIFERQAGLEKGLVAEQWAQDDRRERLDRLVAELRAALAPEPEYRAELGIELWLPADGRYTLEVDYQVPCALWRPAYAAELSGQGEDAKVAWTSAGTVWQRSGEDWTGIELKFSTARPALGAELPLLEDDELAAREKSEREKQVVEVTSRDQVIAKTSDVAPERSDTPPGLDDGGEARTYVVPDKVDVPSDGRPHRVEFDRWEQAAKTELVCMPERAEFVFLRSEQKNASELPLLAGPVSLVRAGGYAGKGQIRYVGAGERFELSWGSEDGLVVMREVDRDYEQTAIRKRKRYDYEVEVYLANHSGADVSLKLTERVPISEIEKVEIELDQKKSTPGFFRDDQGLLAWPVTLTAGEEKRVQLHFRVAMPSNVVWHG